MTLYFYSKGEAYGEFSNFSPHGIEMDGVWWPTVEHYFQAQKFIDPNYRLKIAKASTPKMAKAMGQSRAHPIHADWDERREVVMLEAVRKKFTTHPALKTLLLSTGDETLAEASPNDFYWGAGGDGSGLNRLGEILMQVRTELLLLQ
ncbi:NADAR family protein [Asticcacaulis sp. BYS171W]|uniref:NADAR family protein n=1 Tax=Asticcacaulis aquaticus TaxID=2984212 RepID=A0ABT5HV90_9CAUL|nr:NADAR family protein [Asticcacaulis aquaticus]MDC7683973.1 NADAR family protein [Asticcacaulis aquaticus]